MTDFSYDCTWESTDSLGNIVGSMEVRILYSYTPGKTAPVPHGEYRAIDPDDPPELKISEVLMEIVSGVYGPILGKFPTGDLMHDYYLNWAEMEHSERLEDHAIEMLSAQADAKMEYEYDHMQEDWR